MPDYYPPARQKIKPSDRLYDMSGFGIYRRSSMINLPEDNPSHIMRNYVTNIRDMMNNRMGLFVYGDQQTGKAWRVGAIANELLSRTFTVQFINATDLSRLWFNEKQPFNDEQTLLERLQSVHVLVILGLGKESLDRSGFHAGRLAGFLSNRKNEPNSVTLITSQYSPVSEARRPSPLENHYGKDVADAINQLTIEVELRGASFSQQRKADLKNLLIQGQ